MVQVTGSNQVLTNTTLTGLGLDVLSQVERASLTGDNQANHIDASAFTAGPVTVSGLFGDDTIAGSSSDDTLDGGNGLDVLTQASDTDQVLTNTTLITVRYATPKAFPTFAARCQKAPLIKNSEPVISPWATISTVAPVNAI